MRNPVRLVHVTPYAAPYAGSFIPMLRTVLSSAKRRGWRAEAVLGHGARGRPWLAELESEQIPVHFVHRRPGRAARDELGAILAESDGPAILHTHFTGFDLAAAQVARARANTVVFWHVHMGASRAPTIMARNIAKYSTLGRSVERILCVAPDAADALRRRGARRGSVVFFPNAIDSSRFPLVESGRRAAARTQLGLSDGTHMLLHLGWDWHRKGGPMFLRAAKTLVAGGVPVVAVTVGGGQRARSLAEELELGDAVIAVEPRERIQDFFAAADVFVSCSRAEGMTFALVEALCSGVPVVATDIPGQRLIGPGLAARRLTPLDPLAIAEAVRSLVARDTEVAEAENAAAREWVIGHMDLHPWAERLLGLYDEALDRRGLAR